ncbi:RNA polymerase sigma factor [Hamadaea tsunoensis]|uniref:RNA polymerase sigma factor n=1 Tax=Hamadaea tsunoensis TaxID=53368 RepID=UPI0004857813|nr:sigma-70 family RNA polymerase sigma factor [Hamadaea tsunoensis]
MSDTDPRGGTRDDAWFEKFCLRWRSDVWRWSVRRMGPGPDAEDLMTEVFLRARRYRRAIPDDDPAVNRYLYAMVYNHGARLWRRRRTEQLMPATDVDQLRPPAGDFTERVAEHIDLERAFPRLSYRDRHLLLRTYRDEVSGEDLAAELGIKVDALYKRLERARKRLKEGMRKSGTDGRATGRDLRVWGD